MANHLLLRIEEHLQEFSGTERKVASYILNHPELIPNMTTKELAKKSGVSEASVIRFAKAVGLGSFKTLKISLAQELAVSEEYITDFSIIQKKDSPYDLFQKVVHVNKGAIELLKGSINKKELNRAVDALKQAKRIVFFGVGGSAIAAFDAKYKFTKLGFQAEFNQDFHYMLSMIPHLTREDVFVAISMSGQTKDVVDLAQFAQRKGVTVIAITNINKSPLYRDSDICLATPMVEKDFRVGSITSRMTQLTVIDSLYISLFNSIGKNVVEQYQEAREEMVRLRR